MISRSKRKDRAKFSRVREPPSVEATGAHQNHLLFRALARQHLIPFPALQDPGSDPKRACAREQWFLRIDLWALRFADERQEQIRTSSFSTGVHSITKGQDTAPLNTCSFLQFRNLSFNPAQHKLQTQNSSQKPRFPDNQTVPHLLLLLFHGSVIFIRFLHFHLDLSSGTP